MFCSQCGKEVPAGAAFCGNCGKAVGEARSAVPCFDSNGAGPTPGVGASGSVLATGGAAAGELSQGSKISIGGAGVAVLCFFLPWVRFGEANFGLSVSGWGLASGPKVFGLQAAESAPLLFFAVVPAIVLLILAYNAYRRGKLHRQDVNYTLIAGAVALIITFIAMTNYKFKDVDSRYCFQFGLWATVGGYIAAIVGAVANARELKGKAPMTPRNQ